jgi:excisionase family DNA binding protein
MTRDKSADGAAFIVTITEAAPLLGCSIRTVQRRLDAGEFEAVTVAGKRCVRLTADDLPEGVMPDGLALDATRDTEAGNPSGTRANGPALSPLDASLARVTSHDRNRDGAALIAAIVSRTLDEADARRAAKLEPVQLASKLLLTLAECSALTGLSRATLRAAIEAGALKARRIGKAWRIKRPDLDSFIRRL